MSPTPTSTILNFGVTLLRWNVGPSPDECGAVAFIQQSLDQLYAQQPFPSLFQPLHLNMVHMDHDEQNRRVAARVACLRNYAPDQPGYHVADGLTGSEIDLALFPDGWQVETIYTGPPRPLTEAARQHSRKALSHEFGHWHQFHCCYGGSDDIAKLITAWWRANRPKQAENEWEDWAENFRGCLGADECRGFYSDNKPCNPTPERYAFLRCAYWLAGNLANQKLYDFRPQAGGIQYCVLVNNVWTWRFISNGWQGQEWVPPQNGRAEYWKSI